MAARKDEDEGVISVSRWSRWASQLRGRHGRSDARRASARMVLVHRAGSFTQVLVAAQRTLIRVDARLGVTQMLLAPAALGRQAIAMMPAVDGAMHYRQIAPPSANALPTLRPARAPAAAPMSATAPRFVDGVHARSVGAARRQDQAQRDAAMPAMVTRWRRGSPIAIEARDLPARVRRSATRQELPVAEKVSVLAASRRSGPPDAASQDRTRGEVAAPLARGRNSDAPVPAAPAINVEALTSQVIQQLDRRLVAYRERMGRS
jgi:hypothetical protein